MRSSGIIRKVDGLGRVVLPAEARQSLEIHERDELEIFIDGDQIILQKYQRTCVFCGYDQDLVVYRGKSVCRVCAQGLSHI